MQLYAERLNKMIYQNGYVTGRGHHCLLTCVANYLQYYKIGLDEVDMFFRCNGYKIENDKDGGLTYGITLLNQIDSIGVPYSFCSFSEKEEAYEGLLSLVRKEEAVILFWDAGSLKYNSAFSHAENVNHCVNVIGADENGQIYISDGFIAGFKGSCFEGFVAFEDILPAWEKSGFHYAVIYPDRINEAERAKPRFSEIFSEHADNNLRMEACLSEMLEKLKKQEDRKELTNGLNDLNSYIRNCGMTYVRSYISMAVKTNVNDDEISAGYDEIIKGWNIVNCLLIKLMYVNSAEKLEEIGEKIHTLFIQENELMKKAAKMCL